MSCRAGWNFHPSTSGGSFSSSKQAAPCMQARITCAHSFYLGIDDFGLNWLPILVSVLIFVIHFKLVIFFYQHIIYFLLSLSDSLSLSLIFHIFCPAIGIISLQLDFKEFNCKELLCSAPISISSNCQINLGKVKRFGLAPNFWNWIWLNRIVLD